jgi:stage V sporulation protein D (sporulation-specific penicillin-binding protein)
MRIEPEVVRQVMSKDTSDKVRAMLEGVVSEGTGRNAYVSGFSVAGKTGTSETTEEDRKIASFCSFAPADNPVICVLVMLDDPKGESYMGGAVAAPLARTLLEEILTYLEVDRKYTEAELEKQIEQIVLPDLRNMTVSEAIKTLTGLGLSHKLGSGLTDLDLLVTDQLPQPYVSVTANSMIALYSNKESERLVSNVPDLYNKTLYEATESLKRAGLNIKVTGAGVAKGQSVEAGTEVEMGTIVEVSFRYTDNIE